MIRAGMSLRRFHQLKCQSEGNRQAHTHRSTKNNRSFSLCGWVLINDRTGEITSFKDVHSSSESEKLDRWNLKVTGSDKVPEWITAETRENHGLFSLHDNDLLLVREQVSLQWAKLVDWRIPHVTETTSLLLFPPPLSQLHKHYSISFVLVGRRRLIHIWSFFFSLPRQSSGRLRNLPNVPIRNDLERESRVNSLVNPFSTVNPLANMIGV